MIFPDTDILVDVLRKHPPAMTWLKSLGEAQILLSGFVCAELIQGCLSREEQKRVSDALSDYVVVWPDAQTCDRALLAFSRYHLSHALGLLDALIAQTAMDLDISLCTFNKKHYQCLSRLRTVQPYEKT